mmetsp:Transcript_25590/g.56627  ORF Transcript_25590/g.56627 Transcript_25590/m.56627 type:complete len:222 (-) Transcript_25590:1956-2621(-)
MEGLAVQPAARGRAGVSYLSAREQASSGRAQVAGEELHRWGDHSRPVRRRHVPAAEEPAGDRGDAVPAGGGDGDLHHLYPGGLRGSSVPDVHEYGLPPLRACGVLRQERQGRVVSADAPEVLYEIGRAGNHQRDCHRRASVSKRVPPHVAQGSAAAAAARQAGAGVPGGGAERRRGRAGPSAQAGGGAAAAGCRGGGAYRARKSGAAAGFAGGAGQMLQEA